MRVMGSQVKVRHLRGNAAGKESGVALVLSLVLVTVVAILSAGVVTLSSTTSKMEARSLDQLRAFYLAEAGLAESFAAVRIGRSGAIGDENSPAAYGEGEVWVSAIQTSDNRIWLQSTGFAGNGKATLGLVINPADPPLGFFSSDDFVIEEGVLVDGFDSSERSYEEEILLLNGLDPMDEALSSAFDIGGILTLSTLSAFGPTDPMAPEGWYMNDTMDMLLGDGLQSRIASGADYQIAIEERSNALLSDHTAQMNSKISGLYTESDSIELPPAEPVISVTNTSRGGMLGSNGSIDVRGSDPALVYGSVVPGSKAEVATGSNLFVTESTDSRSLPVELEPVDVPLLPARASITHSDLAPVVISASDGDYQQIQVSSDCELILRGPARISIESLVLSPRAILTLDTRDGDVDMFITGNMTCSDDSIVETTGRRSSEVRIQGAKNGSTGVAAELELGASSSFYGTIYAPESTVRIGAPFEVFGSVVAKRLEVDSGARLHYDNRAYNGNAALPTQEAWRILDLPDSARTRGSAGRSTGLAKLAVAHRLADVKLSLRFLDASGIEQQFTGLESAFDWTRVASVVSVERDVDYRVANTAEERNLLEKWARRVATSPRALSAADAAEVGLAGAGAAGGGAEGTAVGADPAADPAGGTVDPSVPVPAPEPVLTDAQKAYPIGAARRTIELGVMFGVTDISVTLPGGFRVTVAPAADGGVFDVKDADGVVMYLGTIDSGGGVSIRTP